MLRYLRAGAPVVVNIVSVGERPTGPVGYQARSNRDERQRGLVLRRLRPSQPRRRTPARGMLRPTAPHTTGDLQLLAFQYLEVVESYGGPRGPTACLGEREVDDETEGDDDDHVNGDPGGMSAPTNAAAISGAVPPKMAITS